MRFARILFAYLVFCSAAFAQVGQIPSWPPVQPAAVAPSTTTLDPANKGTSQTLSNGNLTVTGTGSDGIVRSIANHSSGKYYLEFTTGSNSIGNGGVGVINSSGNLNTFIAGDSNNAGVAYGASTTWHGAVSGTTTSPGYANSHVYALAIDVGNRTGWIKDLTAAGNWNSNVSADPATNTNGATFTGALASGALYAMASMGLAADIATFNFGATAYVGTPPAGFGNW